jgi:hypothetical protein
MSNEIMDLGALIPDETITSSILIYGDSGAGKTWLAATSEQPLIILAERNGFASAKHSNPNAHILSVSNAKNLRVVFQQIQNNNVVINGEKIIFKTLVFDSLTEMFRLINDEMTHGADGTFKPLEWNRYTEFYGKCRKLVRSLRNLPFNIICTALLETDKSDAETIRYRPLFEGKNTVQNVNQYFSCVGFLGKKYQEETGELVRIMMFEGPSNYTCKRTHPLPNYIVNPTMSSIQKSIETGDPTILS